mmetsp:Transcript_17135/g.39839  ORF Transcript_17135/g.39839 Transcript_17135/m.39839 type:complete len:215 (+) Transcript_17135:413-1057(+)
MNGPFCIRASKPSFASADRPSPISSPRVSTSASNRPTYDAKGRPMVPTEGGTTSTDRGRDRGRDHRGRDVTRNASLPRLACAAARKAARSPPPATTTLLLVLLVSTAQWTPRRHAEAVETASASDRDGGRTARESRRSSAPPTETVPSPGPASATRPITRSAVPRTRPPSSRSSPSGDAAASRTVPARSRFRRARGVTSGTGSGPPGRARRRPA